MKKQLLRLVEERDFIKTDQEHRNLGPRGINIWYGYDNDFRDVSQMNSIAREIRKDFPSMRYSDMVICVIQKTQSTNHAGQALLRIRVYLDHFLDLRKKENFGIL